MPKKVLFYLTDGVITSLDLIILCVSYMTFGLFDFMAVFGPFVCGRILIRARSRLRRIKLDSLYLGIPILYAVFIVSLFTSDGITFDSVVTGAGLIPILFNSMEYLEW
jgi:hypothetical protein